MGKLMFEMIVHIVEYQHAYGMLPFHSLIFEVLRLQKNTLKENEILEALQSHLQIFHKLFEGRHAQDIQEEEVIPDDVLDSATDVNPELFYSYLLN